MRKLLIGVVFVLCISLFLIYKELVDTGQSQIFPRSSTKTPITEPRVNIRASFAIFTNGTFRIFSDPKYHNKSPDVYIPTDQTNIVLVSGEDITWSDFFKTLPMKLEKDCLTTGTGQLFCSDKINKLKFYINGRFDPDALERKINENDKFLVSFGNSDNNLKEEFSQIPDVK